MARRTHPTCSAGSRAGRPRLRLRWVRAAAPPVPAAPRCRPALCGRCRSSARAVRSRPSSRGRRDR
eukprot:5060998-Prymnesium_polylepis.1